MHRNNNLNNILVNMNSNIYGVRKRIRRDEIQRRSPAVDLYGVKSYKFGDSNVPAEVFVWISPDLIKIERFEFKITITDMVLPFASAAIMPTELTVSTTHIPDTPNDHNHNISPNPHAHDLNIGASTTTSNINNFRLSIEGIDMTAYFATQYGIWVTGNGTYPNLETTMNFDVIEACNHISPADQKKILSAGGKSFLFQNEGLFNLEFTLYLKFTHANR